MANHSVTVNDTDSDAGTYPYKVTIEYNNKSYTSDPQIINKG